MANCPYCGAVLGAAVHHSSECPNCSRSLHTCKACTFYSKDAHYGCRESVDEPVWDKESPNFCDYFQLTGKAIGKQGDDRAMKSREALSRLFDL